MAGEFKHVSVGTELSQAEWESTAGHVLNSQATGDLIYASSDSQLTRLGIGSTGQVLTVSGGLPAWVAASGPTVKYKTATQVFSATTTYANITASSGDFDFSVVANGVYVARFILPVTFGGTGGLKLQLTGPASPTLVRVDMFGQLNVKTEDDPSTPSTTYSDIYRRLQEATSFAAILARDSNGTTGILNSTFIAEVLIVNGANAGTVTLQGAQNSANSTTTLAIGSRMEVTRVA